MRRFTPLLPALAVLGIVAAAALLPRPSGSAGQPPISIAVASGRWEPVLEFGGYGGAADIAVDSQHEVYVVGAPGQIQVFSQNGEYLRELGGFSSATGIAIDEDDTVYLQEWCRVWQYSRQFTPLGNWDSCIGLGDLRQGLSLDVRHDIAYVATISKVLKFSADGVFMLEMPRISEWVGVSTLPDTSLMALSHFGMVRHFSPNGDLLDEWPTLLPDETGSYPKAIDIDSNGRVFVADNYGHGRVKIFLATGVLDELIEIPLRMATALELDGDEILYVGVDFPTGVMKFVYNPLTVEGSSWGRIKAHFK